MLLDYGGLDEVNRAVRRMAEANALEEEVFDWLDTRGHAHPRVDVVVRSSGERRSSGLLPLQAAYSEMFFLGRHFPDVSVDDLDEIAVAYGQRQRRFGG